MHSRYPGPLLLAVLALSLGACKKEFITVHEADPVEVIPSQCVSGSTSTETVLATIPLCPGGGNVWVMDPLDLDPDSLHEGDGLHAVLHVGLSQIGGTDTLVCSDLNITLGAFFNSGTASEEFPEMGNTWPTGAWTPGITSNLAYRIPAGSGPFTSPSVRPYVKVCHDQGVCSGAQCTITGASLTVVVVHDHM